MKRMEWNVTQKKEKQKRRIRWIVSLCMILATVTLMIGMQAYADHRALEDTRERILGTWVHAPEGENYRIEYTFARSGMITQKAYGYDMAGNEIDLSMGSAIGLNYEVVRKDAIILSGSVQEGVQSEPQTIPVTFPDDETMTLGDSTYSRYGCE